MAFQKGNKAAAGADHSKRKIVTQQLIAALNEPHGDVKKIRSVVTALLDEAIKGDVAAIKEVFDRVEGKAAPAADGLGSEDNPFNVAFRWAS